MLYCFLLCIIHPFFYQESRMKEDIVIKNGISIPAHELIITASRSGGPGGQFVNKTSSKITLRWNIPTSSALTEEQKTRVLAALASELTNEGDIIIHHSSSRSQQQNKKHAIELLVTKIRKALYVPKKRIKTATTKQGKEKRLHEKKQHSEIKKMRKVTY